jgi:predicted TIM-barrel fold metal-dependent hydrolase
MYKVIDGDGHIFEWEQTFADEFLDEEYWHRRPVIVDGPQQLLWAVDNVTYPGLYGDRLSFGGSPVSRAGIRRDSIVPKPESLGVLEIRDADERIALHKAEGIDIAVIYPTLLLIRPLSYDLGFEAALCKSYNSWMAHVCSTRPDELKWVAVIDMSDPEAAADEIRRCKKIGAVGVMLPGMNGDQSITERKYDPIWAACEAENLAVGVHVAYCTPLNQYTFVFSLLMGFEQVVASGVLDRFPRLRVSFLEASCNWVPFMVERAEEKANPERNRFAPTRPLDTVIDRPEQGGYRSELSPYEYIKRGNLWFGFEVEDPLLPYCLEHFGEDCWVYGSDIPHGDRLKDAAKVLQKRSDISDDAKRKMLRDNVARYYDMPIPE